MMCLCLQDQAEGYRHKVEAGSNMRNEAFPAATILQVGYMT
jgi:hypothetical protein